LLAPFGNRPFSKYQGRKIEALKSRFSRLVSMLHESGRIDARYSFHDLRHAFAETHKTKGLFWLKNALGHSSVSVTEGYLRNVLKTDPKSFG